MIRFRIITSPLTSIFRGGRRGSDLPRPFPKRSCPNTNRLWPGVLPDNTSLGATQILLVVFYHAFSQRPVSIG
jgi:hypothetical protein